MRATGLIACVAVATTILTNGAWGQLQNKPAVVVCPEVSRPPVLDGRIDPAEWAAGGCLSDFVLLGGRGLPRLPTRVRVMHTRSALYIAAQMEDDKPGDLVANVRERDGRVYEDDCLEVFVVEAGQSEYAHFVVNSLGTRFDEYGKDVAENFEWNAVAAVTAAGWSLEIELPFGDQGAPLEGETWRLGVARNAARAGELSTWGGHIKSFGEVASFGELIFKAPLLTAQIDDLGDQTYGDNLALISVHNLAAASVTVKLNAVVQCGDRRGHFFGTTKKQIPGRGTVQVYVPYKIRRCTPGWMAFSLTDDRGAVAWRSAAFPITLPEVSDVLDEGLHTVAMAWKAWTRVSDPATREALGAKLEGLQREWSYLDRQVTAGGVHTARLAAIREEALRFRDRAAAVRQEIEDAAKSSR